MGADIEPIDVTVIGSGPAGAAAARLLTSWGRRVVLVERVGRRRVANVAEALPSSVRNVLRLAGLSDAVDAAGFGRSAGNVVWWGTGEARIEEYGPGQWGYHVERAGFDALLRQQALDSGVEISGSIPEARYVLDCSGRAGWGARRGGRVADGGRMLALGAVWRKADGFPHARYTWMEAYADGWAWSVPMGEDRRYVSLMIEKARGASSYEEELRKAPAIGDMLKDARMEASATGCDASSYHAARYVDGNMLLVGDAASFVDPLSSFGVKKALSSAWMAAVAVNTCLCDDGRAPLALDYYEERERQVYSDLSRQCLRLYQEMAAKDGGGFWQRRAAALTLEEFYERGDLVRQLEWVREVQRLELRRADSVKMAMRPVVEGNEVVLRERLVAAGLPSGLEYVNGVEVSALIAAAERCTTMPELVETYNQSNDPVDWPNLLGALCLLLAKGVLVSGSPPLQSDMLRNK